MHAGATMWGIGQGMQHRHHSQSPPLPDRGGGFDQGGVGVKSGPRIAILVSPPRGASIIFFRFSHHYSRVWLPA
jgi:hypothetical protein